MTEVNADIEILQVQLEMANASNIKYLREIAETKAELEKATTVLEMLTAPEQAKYVLRLYSQLSEADKIKIDTLMAALAACKA